jgi:hypothetical protein
VRPGEGAQLQVVAHRHLCEHLASFGHLGDAALNDLVGRLAGDVLAVQQDPTA